MSQYSADQIPRREGTTPLLRNPDPVHRPLNHGGNLQAAEARFGRPAQGWLDLSTGISPWSFPFDAVPDAHWQRLPHLETALEEAAAAYYQTRAPLAIPGSQFAIQRLPGLFRRCRVALPSWGYNEHIAAWEAAGHQTRRYDDGDLQALEQRMDSGELDIVLVINPNNPSGQLISRERLQRWHQTLAAQGGYLIVDEAFMDASPAQSLSSCCPQEGLVVLRSLGKFFGLAGIRLGFLLAPAAIRAAIAQERGPWAIPGPCAWVGRQALTDQAWQAQQRDHLHTQGERLTEILRHQLGPLAVSIRPTAYFTTLFLAPSTADAIYAALGQQGILIRYFEPQQDVSALRFGLPATDQARQRLIQALQGARR